MDSDWIHSVLIPSWHEDVYLLVAVVRSRQHSIYVKLGEFAFCLGHLVFIFLRIKTKWMLILYIWVLSAVEGVSYQQLRQYRVVFSYRDSGCPKKLIVTAPTGYQFEPVSPIIVLQITTLYWRRVVGDVFLSLSQYRWWSLGGFCLLPFLQGLLRWSSTRAPRSSCGNFSLSCSRTARASPASSGPTKGTGSSRLSTLRRLPEGTSHVSYLMYNAGGLWGRLCSLYLTWRTSLDVPHLMYLTWCTSLDVPTCRMGGDVPCCLCVEGAQSLSDVINVEAWRRVVVLEHDHWFGLWQASPIDCQRGTKLKWEGSSRKMQHSGLGRVYRYSCLLFLSESCHVDLEEGGRNSGKGVMIM